MDKNTALNNLLHDMKHMSEPGRDCVINMMSLEESRRFSGLAMDALIDSEKLRIQSSSITTSVDRSRSRLDFDHNLSTLAAANLVGQVSSKRRGVSRGPSPGRQLLSPGLQGKIAPEFQDYATGSETSSLLLRFPVPDLARAEQSQEQDEEDQTDADYTPDTDRPSKIRRVKQNTLFPFIILVPEANGEESFKAFSELPATVQDELKKRFEDTRLSCSTRERIFKRVCNNPDRFPAKELCVRYLLVSNGGNSYIKAAYRDGGAYEKGADDMCIGHNNPCACLKHHHGDFAFCFVPLPAKLRTGKTWQELRFWVLSGQHRV